MDTDNLTPSSPLETPLSRRQALQRAALLALGLGGLRAATSPLVAAAAVVEASDAFTNCPAAFFTDPNEILFCSA